MNNDLVFRDLLRSRIAILGILFFAINAYTTYQFYHVNTFKMLMLAASVAILFVIDDCFGGQRELADNKQKQTWLLVVILLLPAISTLPGVFTTPADYGFYYELSSDLILVAWAGYVFRRLQNSNDLNGLLKWIALTCIYVCVLAVLERLGLSPLTDNGVAVARPKATFGNINYFAGYLTTIIPLLFLLTIGYLIECRRKFTLGGLLFLLAFILAAVAMLLTKTRAANAATWTGCILAFGVFSLHMLSTRLRVLSFIAIGCICMLLGAGIIYFVLHPASAAELFPRYGQLFSIDAWYTRLKPFETAWRAIIASPIIGYGLGSSYNVNFIYMNPDALLYIDNNSYNHVHNETLELAEDGGALILLTLLSIYTVISIKLFAVFRHPAAPMLHKLVALGVIAGIFNFYFHGQFSVAQRMIVANLPLYTLLAIGCYVIYQHNVQIHGRGFLLSRISFSGVLANNTNLRFFWRGSCALVSIAGVVIATSIASTFYQFTELQISNDSPVATIEKAEKLILQGENPYLKDILLSIQLNHQRIDQAIDTVNLIKEIIPQYRNVGYKYSKALYAKGDYQGAIREARAFQRINVYNIPNIKWLYQLALQTKDEELFWQQLTLMFRYAAVRNKLTSVKQLSAIRIDTNVIQAQPAVLNTDSVFVLSLNQLVSKLIYQQSLKNRAFGANVLLKLIQRQPFFEFVANNTSETRYFNKVAKQYFTLDAARKNAESAIIARYKARIHKVSSQSQLDELIAEQPQAIQKSNIKFDKQKSTLKARLATLTKGGLTQIDKQKYLPKLYGLMIP